MQKKYKFIYLSLALFILIFSITGATYAYFALSASNNNTIMGTAGTASLSLTVTKSFPTSTASMVPQLESALDKAISTTYSCIDGNGNVVCHVYKAVVKNTGTTSAELNGTISFQNIATLPNLKWKRLTSEREFGEDTGHTATTSEQVFESKKIFTPNETATYYFVVWIDEIGANQTDSGTFHATINFKPSDGEGLTSTITSLKLSEVEPGSYVAYTGNNGCSGEACKGVTVSSGSTYNGWRVAYTKNDNAYLVSAGVPERMCTNSDGTSSNGSCSGWESTEGIPRHLSNLDNTALRYCNPTYAYGGVCNSSSAWAMDANDFQNITGKPLNSSSCYYSRLDRSCGYENDLIDNGDYYWFATLDSASANAFYWSRANQAVISNYSSEQLYGVRPVLRLSSNVLVVGGTGTYEDPYQISNGT